MDGTDTIYQQLQKLMAMRWTPTVQCQLRNLESFHFSDPALYDKVSGTNLVHAFFHLHWVHHRSRFSIP